MSLCKNEQAGTSDVVGLSATSQTDMMSDSSEEMSNSSGEDYYYPSSSSTLDSNSDYSDDSDFEITIEMPSTSSLEPQNKPNLADELKTCFIKHGVTHKFVNNLLEILRKHHKLPKDVRTH